MSEIYIVTPNLNGEKFLEEYFNSLKKQRYKNFKIIVIDNASKDKSIEIIEKYKKNIFKDKLILIKLNENMGFAKATNIGIKEAFKDKECKYIVCLNNDIKLEQNFLEELIKCAKKYKNAGSIQSKMIWWQYPNLIDSAGLNYSYNGLAFNRGAYENIKKYNKEEEILGSCAGAALYKREALEDIMIDNEIFDEDFFAYYEDVDLSLRLRWAGWKIYFCPNAICYHYKGGTGGSTTPFNTYYRTRNYTLTYIKNLPLQYIFKHFLIFLLVEFLQIIHNLSRGHFIVLKAKIDALKLLKKTIIKRKKIKKKTKFSDIKKFFVRKWNIKIISK